MQGSQSALLQTAQEIGDFSASNHRYAMLRSRVLTLAATVVMASLVAGCRGGPVSVENWRENHVVQLWASKSCADYGEIVTIRATATNRDSRPLIVELKDQPVFDIIVGSPVTRRTRWSTGKPLTPDLTRLELMPGQSKTIEMQWIASEGEGVTARFIDNALYSDNPVNPNFFIYVGNCPGLIGP